MAFYASLEPTVAGGFDRMNLTISGDVSFELTDIFNVILHKDGQSISDTVVFSDFEKTDYNGDTLVYIDFSNDVAVTSGPGVYKVTFQYRGQMYCSSSFTWCEGEQPKGISQYD